MIAKRLSKINGMTLEEEKIPIPARLKRKVQKHHTITQLGFLVFLVGGGGFTTVVLKTTSQNISQSSDTYEQL